MKRCHTRNIIACNQHHWSASLIMDMKDPKNIFREDNQIVVMKDKYPKAQYHYLVLPKVDIRSLWHVKKEHRNLLLHMDKIAQELTNEHLGSEFLIGYHAVPSMQRLHLHVISTDFNSPSLKTMRHWNAFNTSNFLLSSDICNQLQEREKLKRIPKQIIEQYFNTPLKCNRCSATAEKMPELKRHLKSHLLL